MTIELMVQEAERSVGTSRALMLIKIRAEKQMVSKNEVKS